MWILIKNSIIYPSSKYQFQFHDCSLQRQPKNSTLNRISVLYTTFDFRNQPESEFSTLHTCTVKIISAVREHNPRNVQLNESRAKTFLKLDIYKYMSYKSENERVNREPKNKSSIL